MRWKTTEDCKENGDTYQIARLYFKDMVDKTVLISSYTAILISTVKSDYLRQNETNRQSKTFVPKVMSGLEAELQMVSL